MIIEAIVGKEFDIPAQQSAVQGHLERRGAVKRNPEPAFRGQQQGIFAETGRAGVSQSISQRHQFSVEVMFAGTTETIKSLLNEPVFDFRIPAQPACQSLVAWTQGSGHPAIEQTGRDAGFAPGTLFIRRSIH